MNRPRIAIVFLLFVAGNDCSITDNTVVSTGCKGENLTIYWEYSDAGNMNSVTWEFITGSTLILVQGATGAAVVQNNFKVEHINNGEIKLTDLTAANVGTYKITVAYSSATPSASDTFEVTAIHDAPTGLSYTDVGSVVTCSATSLGSPAAQLYLKVDGTDTGLTSDTIDEGSGKAVECCLKGDSIECMTTSPCVTVRWSATTSSTNTSTSSNNTTPTVNASTISTATNPPTATSKITCDGPCIIIVPIVVPLVALLVFIFVCCWLRRRRNNKKEKYKSKVTNSGQLYDNETSH